MTPCSYVLFVVLFYDASIISYCVGWVIMNWKRYRGRRSRPDWCPGILSRYWGKPRITAVVLAKIRTIYLPNAGMEPYPHTSLFCLWVSTSVSEVPETSVFIVQDGTLSQPRRRYFERCVLPLKWETKFHTHIGTGSVVLYVSWRKEATTAV
jgi:hypothetical protein